MVRTLPLEFSRSSKFRHNQVFREGPWAIYKVEGLGKIPTYEVIIIRIVKAHPKDLDQTPKEYYPSSEDWGKYGWTKPFLKDAESKVSSLKEERGEKVEQAYKSQTEKFS